MTPPKDPRPSALPYIIGWCLFVPYAGLQVTLALANPAGMHGTERSGFTGVVVTSVVLPAAIALVATLRRSAAALAAAAAITALGFCGVTAAVMKHYADRHVKMLELSKRVDELKARVGQSKAPAAERAAEVDRLVADVEQTADEVGDGEADALRCAALTIRDVATPGRAYDDRVAEIGAIGLLDAAKILTRADLDERYRLVAAAEAANEEVDAHVKDMAAFFERCARAHAVPDAMAREAADAMRHDPRVADLATFRDVERKVLGDMHAMLAFFDETWGHWRATTEQLEIERPKDLERYKKIKGALDATVQEESVVQARLRGPDPG